MEKFLAWITPVGGEVVPKPPEPGGPVDPGYSPPWAQVPEVPVGPEPPLVDPDYGIDEGTGIVTPTPPIVLPPEEVPPAVLLIPVAAVDVPEGAPEGTTAAIAWKGPGYYPVFVFVTPRAQPKK